MLRSAALAALVCATAGGAPIPRALVPQTIAFWDARHGLIGAGGAIARTDDGGRTSSVVRRTAGPVYWLDVAPGGFAWATVGVGPDRLLRTSDGGRTWQRLPRAVLRPSFADGSHGIALTGQCLDSRCPRGALLLTSDGGRTWRRSASPCVEPATASLATPSLGWLLCVSEPGAGEQGKSIYRTTDGGRTWERLLSVPSRTNEGGISLAGYALGVAFAPNGVGLLWEGRGWLYLTGDGGRHWRALVSVDSPGHDDVGRSAAVVAGRGYLLVNRAYRTALVASTRGYGDWRTIRIWKTAP